MDAQFGDAENPLLLSVRSGARSSMPGMMETVLNIGLTAQTIPGTNGLRGKRPEIAEFLRRLGAHE